MFHLMAAGILEYADERIAIGANAGEGIVNRCAHARLRRQMYNSIGLSSSENIPRCFDIREIRIVKCKTRVLLQIIEPGALQRRIVIGRERINPDHLVATREQSLAHLHADEAGSPGNENGS